MDTLDEGREPRRIDRKAASIATAVGSDLMTMMSQLTIVELEQISRQDNIISNYLTPTITRIHAQTHIKKICQDMEPSTIHP